MNKYSAIARSCGAIWAGIALISVLSPDLVSGSQHEHLPLAALTAWLWGMAATGYLTLLVMASDSAKNQNRWQILVVSTSIVWAVAAAVSVFSPSLVTGSDSTRVPLAALIAPPVACISTALICLITAIRARWAPEQEPQRITATV